MLGAESSIPDPPSSKEETCSERGEDNLAGVRGNKYFISMPLTFQLFPWDIDQ